MGTVTDESERAQVASKLTEACDTVRRPIPSTHSSRRRRTTESRMVTASGMALNRRWPQQCAETVINDDEPLDGFDRVYVSDPFGNRIELMQPSA